MTREQAIKRLRTLYGTRAYYRVGQALTSPEKRAHAADVRQAAHDLRDALDAAIKERLAALDWYQAMTAERRKAFDAMERAAGLMSHYRFCVGRNIGYANKITAQGDTWEECFAKIHAKAEGQ